MNKEAGPMVRDKEAEGRRRYSSPLMAERRRKILSETLTLIEEKGIDAVTIQEISERAGVAQKTLYNVIGDRDAIVALAIDYCQESFFSALTSAPILTIDDALNYMAACCAAFIDKRAWTAAATAIYFSPNVDERIYKSLVSLANLYFSALLKYYRENNLMRPWTPVDIVELQFSNAAHVVSHDWAKGRTPDHLYGLKMNLTILITLIPFASDFLRPQLTERLETITRALTGE